MAKNKKIKRNKKEEPRIIIFTAVICALLCILYSFLAERAVDSLIQQLSTQSLSRQYARMYLEKIEGGIINTREIESDYEIDPDYGKYFYYSCINDKSADLNEIIGSYGATGFTVNLCHYGVSTWVADRETLQKVGNYRCDYVIFGEERSTRFPADMHETFSDEEYHHLCEYYNRVNNELTYVDDVRSYEAIYPYLDKYVYRDGIAYPLVISFRQEGMEDVSFCADRQFEYDPSEVIEADNYMMYDDPADPLDPSYQLALTLSGKQYGFFSSWNSLPSEITYHSRGITGNTMITTTDEHVLCMAEVVNYKGLLDTVIGIGCTIITLISVVIALTLCGKARHKRQKAEYERSVTNALAHNYKSSLMVVRSCAENLIWGVSGEKKAKYEKMIISETDRMNESTEKVLSFYRTGAAGYEPADDTIDASAVCRELIEKHESISAERKLEWKVDDAEKFTFKGDSVLFAMAMDNLIGNAAKYALSGSTVNIRTYSTGMTLENNWKPVDKFIKKPKRFFEAFVTGDDTPGRSNSGLGLSVAKDLFERMKLKISAKANTEKVTFEIKKK